MMIVILGLGSNLGDRLYYLRSAGRALISKYQIKRYQFSPIYRSDALLLQHNPPSWNLPYLNVVLQLQFELAQPTPLNLLHEIKIIEHHLGRQKEKGLAWGAPRTIDIDILAIDHLIITTPKLTIPHPGLLTRRFALWPLADITPFWRYPIQGPHCGQTAEQLVSSWGSRFKGEDPLHTRQLAQRISPPQWAGILNVTPNSFSDGNQFLDPEQALAQIHSMVEAGAEIIDIGAESTAPKAKPVDPDLEWKRLHPILEAMDTARHNWIIPPKISIDTRHACVATKAMDYRPDWINDVSALTDPAMCDLITNTSLHCVIMHHLRLPEDPAYRLPSDQNITQQIIEWGKEQIQRLEKVKISPNKLILDPGLGFGKSAAQSWELIKNVNQLSALKIPIMIGHSRKSFLTWASSTERSQDRDIETVAISLYLAEQAVDFLRIHNVCLHHRSIAAYRHATQHTPVNAIPLFTTIASGPTSY